MADLTGMMQAAAGVGGEEADEYFQNTVLLLHGDGINGQQNNVFLDSSSNAFNITRNGDTTQGTFSPFSKPNGRWGNSFLGDTDYITCTSNAAYQFDTGDFTIECWLYTTALVGSAGKVFQYATDGNFSSGGYGLEQVTNANTLTWGRSTGIVTLTSSAPTNEWFHFAIVRSSGTLTAYLNGVSVYSAADSYDYNYGGAHPFAIGSGRNGAGNFTDDYTGYISNFRVVKGTAVYTGAFTPSTTPLTAISGTSLLTCQSNRFKDNSTNNFAITVAGDTKVTPFSPFPLTTEYTASINGGSGFFDGSGDKLQSASNAALALGSNDFSLEWWEYRTVVAAEETPVSTGDYSGPYASSLFGYGGTVGGISTDGASWNVFSFPAFVDTVYAGTWNHFVYTRSGTAFRVFMNGKLSNYTTASGSVVQNNNQWNIGSGISGNLDYTGYISDVRVCIGSIPSLYQTSETTPGTAVFTPPSAPLTASTQGASNTELLTNFTNSGILDNTCFNDLITVGDAAVNTTTKKYGTGSMEFDGTGDYLVAPHSPDQNIGGGDWTGECWVYVTTKSNSVFFAKGPGSGNWEYFFGYDGPTLVMLYGMGSYKALTDSITLNTWTHVAMVRNGSTLTAYVDGSSVGSVTYTGNATTSENLGVGGAIPLVGSGYVMKGYIDDLRITKGIARYTTAFTPPTAAFPNIGE